MRSKGKAQDIDEVIARLSLADSSYTSGRGSFSKPRSSRRKSADLDNAIAQLSLADSSIAASRINSCFLALPDRVHDRISHHLPCRAYLFLSATCRRLHARRAAAYTDLSFPLSGPERQDVLANTVFSLRLLAGVLAAHPEYCASIRTIRFRSDNVVAQTQKPFWKWEELMDTLDEYIACILPMAHGLRRFEWASRGDIGTLRLTMPQLPFLPNLRELFLSNAWMPRNCTFTLDEKPLRLEEVWIECGLLSPDWCNILLLGNTSLRQLHIRQWRCNTPDEVEWIKSMDSAASAWHNLHTLTVTTQDGLPLQWLMAFLNRQATSRCWPSLSTVSINAWLHDGLLADLMKILSYFPIRRLHIGNYDPTFTPQFIAELADHLPLLEELSLHHHQTHIFQPLQVDLNLWGESLRRVRNLRVLTLPVLYVADQTGKRTVVPGFDEEDVEEVEEDEEGEEDDDAMDIDDDLQSQGELSSETLDIAHKSYLPCDLSNPRSRLRLILSVFAENLIDDYLYKPDFLELRFVHLLSRPDANYQECRMVRFRQLPEPSRAAESDGQERYMVRYLGEMQDCREEDEAFFWAPYATRR